MRVIWEDPESTALEKMTGRWLEITGDTLSDGGGIGGSSIARELEARSGLVQFRPNSAITELSTLKVVRARAAVV